MVLRANDGAIELTRPGKKREAMKDLEKVYREPPEFDDIVFRSMSDQIERDGLLVSDNRDEYMMESAGHGGLTAA